MAITHKQFSPIQLRNEWSANQKAALFKVLNNISGTLTPRAAPAAFTDSSGGVVSNTIAAITAGGTYAQADLVACKNAIASLSSKVNAIRTALVNAGVLT